MVCPKFETELLGKKTGGLQKKKKVFTEIESDFFGENRKFKQFFSPKTCGLQKKKKKKKKGLHLN